MSTIHFAEQLKQLRKQKGLSQDSVAEKLFISRQAVSRWESGEATPDVANLVELADFLGVGLDELVLNRKPDASYSESTSQQDIVTQKHQMNGWEFLARYWWLIFAIGGWLTWFIPKIVQVF